MLKNKRIHSLGASHDGFLVGIYPVLGDVLERDRNLSLHGSPVTCIASGCELWGGSSALEVKFVRPGGSSSHQQGAEASVGTHPREPLCIAGGITE